MRSVAILTLLVTTSLVVPLWRSARVVANLPSNPNAVLESQGSQLFQEIPRIIPCNPTATTEPSDFLEFVQDLTPDSSYLLDHGSLTRSGVVLQPITVYRQDGISVASLLNVIVHEMDPKLRRVHLHLEDDFGYVATTDSIKRLENFEARTRYPSSVHPQDELSRRLFQVGHAVRSEYPSLTLSGSNLSTAVQAISTEFMANVQVDWAGIEASKWKPRAPFKVRIGNGTLCEYLEVLFAETYDLDHIAFSYEGRVVHVCAR